MEQCCPGGACPKEGSCCGSECCFSNAVCGADGFCSRKATPTPVTSVLVSRSAGRTIAIKTSTASRIACPTGLTSQKEVSSLVKRQRPFPKCCNEETQPDGSKLPVWELSGKAGETDQLIKSMCEGIAASQQRRKINEPDYEPVDGEDLLTYAGGRGPRGKAAKCKGFCKAQNRGRPRADRVECDEYPPASFEEGGGFSTRVCVPWYQNSGTQGPMLSRILDVCGLKSGEQVRIRIKGGCKNLVRRQEPSSAEESSAPTTMDLSEANSTLRDPYGDGSLTYIALPLGELADGRYDVNVKFAGNVEKIAVVNDAGDEYSR